MKKALFSIVLTAFIGFSSSLALAGEPTAEQKARSLADAATEACLKDVHLAPYELGNFERYVGQTVFPDLKMLNAAFMRAFNTFNSAHLRLSYCVITFVGIPNDPYWEKSFSYYDRATAEGTLPATMFTGFDENGAVILKPIERRN